MECGNCGETASLGFMEFLKGRYQGSIEVIYLATSASLFATNHYIVVLNRDKEKDALDNIFNWSSQCAIVDGWYHILYKYSNSSINLPDLIYEILGKKRNLVISSKIRVENAEEFLKYNINYFLTLLNTFREYIISDKFFNELEKDAATLVDTNLSEIRKNFLTLIDRDLAYYQLISNINQTSAAFFNFSNNNPTPPANTNESPKFVLDLD